MIIAQEPLIVRPFPELCREIAMLEDLPLAQHSQHQSRMCKHVRRRWIGTPVQGRALRPGDQLPLSHGSASASPGLSVPSSWRPNFPAKGNAWEVGVLPGPNGSPDYFTDEDINTLHTATYTVHYNS